MDTQTQQSAQENIDDVLLEGYMRRPGHFDEMLDDEGKARPHWQSFLKGLHTLGGEGLELRNSHLKRIIREHGVTYNVYGDPQGSSRPWGMDIIPNLVANADWTWLEQALSQRLHLFNLLLADLYGPMTSMHRGLFPPEAILNTPGFLRACSNVRPYGGRHIHLYAADLARSPDGRWWVLSDRIEAPSGIGYCLENRYITTRVLPELFRDAHVMPLSPFFSKMRKAFESLVPRRTEEPKIVMLTPGPANETYFEQSYLARNLGYPLVEGGDLMVREGRVWLKTVSGREPVDVILRRLDSSWCDPLELNDESLLGIAGLLEVVRNGNVAVANALGSGVLQAPAFLPFLDSAAQAILGESLAIPSVATWWCGQETECRYVLDNLEELVIKPINAGGKAAFGHLLSESEREELKRRILYKPNQYCAQEMVAEATTPVFTRSRLQARNFLMRVYLVSDGDGYSMMPGALTRISPEISDPSVSMQRGGISQDSWMLQADDAPPEAFPIPITHTVRLNRQSAELPSRVADNLYWHGRYIERADNLCRIARMLLEGLLTDLDQDDSDSCQHFLDFILPENLMQPLVPESALGPLFAEPSSAINPMGMQEAIETLLWQEGTTGGLLEQLGAIEITAHAIKERLPGDANHTHAHLRELADNRPERPSTDSNLSRLDHVLIQLAALGGYTNENMTRDNDWRFLDLGRRIERTINLAALIGATLSPNQQDLRTSLSRLLICADSAYTYRGRYLNHIQLVPLLDLLVIDESNPRSLAFQARHIHEHVRALPELEVEPLMSLEKRALSLYSNIRLADLRELAFADKEGRRNELADYCETVEEKAMQLSEGIGQQYFTHGIARDYQKL